MTGEFNAVIGAVVAALAPLWFVLLADIHTRDRLRVALLVLLLVVFAALTVLLGAGIALWASGGDGALLLQVIEYFIGLVLPVLVITAVWIPLRRRGLARARWHEEHPDEDRAPITRAERRLASDIDAVRRWHERVRLAMTEQTATRGWVTSSAASALETERPVSPSLARASRRTGRFLAEQSPAARAAVADWRLGLDRLRGEVNGHHRGEVVARESAFFDGIESSPLTDEQREAVICFDDRVRLVAAAGSGKTSTVVAKAAYAVRSGLVAPERVLVLAFNDSAAKEVDRRMERAFRSAGLDGRVRASTFHAFGLSVIGAARGRKPSLARAVDQRRVPEALASLVRTLRREDPSFRRGWDLFRHVYFERTESFHVDSPDDVLLTRSGVRVRSSGECVIADWLWYHGVEFEYERRFFVDTVDAEHGQYTPDFYYPAVDLWHEHWALDRFGAAPAHFEDYLEGIAWKRGVHAAAGTRLLETTTAETDDGSALRRLEASLVEAGVELRPDPDRTSAGRAAVPEAKLLELLEKMLRRVRAMGDGEISRAAAAGSARTRLLLELVSAVRLRWEAMLDQEEAVDYEGMVSESALAIEQGKVEPEFDLILVDEFQDISADRARLVQALLRRPGSRLFAVGDDWQAINGFAGSVLTEMTAFEERWGAGTTLRLERTFRSSQPICDVAGAFVSRNPTQIAKTVRSNSAVVARPVVVQAAANGAGQTEAARAWLVDLQRRIDEARRRGKDVRSRTVLVLGRYNWTQDLAPRTADLPDLRCTFSTIHSAKGAEADHVVLLDLVAGSRGFPATQPDDPALRAILPIQDPFLHAEERRLLYVALTRARRSVLLLTDAARPSPFVAELAQHDAVDLVDGRGAPATICPTCRAGLVVTREGRYGRFEACGVARGCSYRRSIGSPAKHRPLSLRP